MTRSNWPGGRSKNPPGPTWWLTGHPDQYPPGGSRPFGNLGGFWAGGWSWQPKVEPLSGQVESSRQPRLYGQKQNRLRDFSKNRPPGRSTVPNLTSTSTSAGGVLFNCLSGQVDFSTKYRHHVTSEYGALNINSSIHKSSSAPSVNLDAYRLCEEPSCAQS